MSLLIAARDLPACCPLV